MRGPSSSKYKYIPILMMPWLRNIISFLIRIKEPYGIATPEIVVATINIARIATEMHEYCQPYLPLSPIFPKSQNKT